MIFCPWMIAKLHGSMYSLLNEKTSTMMMWSKTMRLLGRVVSYHVHKKHTYGPKAKYVFKLFCFIAHGGHQDGDFVVLKYWFFDLLTLTHVTDNRPSSPELTGWPHKDHGQAKAFMDVGSANWWRALTNMTDAKPPKFVQNCWLMMAVICGDGYL